MTKFFDVLFFTASGLGFFFMTFLFPGHPDASAIVPAILFVSIGCFGLAGYTATH